MTMAPYLEDPEKTRPYFRQVKEIFEKIKILNLSNTEIKTLSMGMSHSYKVAIEEGANMVRIGTAIFIHICWGWFCHGGVVSPSLGLLGKPQLGDLSL